MPFGYFLSLWQKKLNGSGDYPLTGLQHQVPWELKREILLTIELNQEMVVCEHVDRFMKQPTGPHNVLFFNKYFTLQPFE